MVAKKMPPKKMAAPKKTASAADFRKKEEADKAKAKTDAAKNSKSNKGGGLAQSLPKPNKKSQAGDLASERGVMRQAAQRNRANREQSKNYDFGLVNVTYRENGELKNSVMNRRRGSTFPASNYIFMGDTSKKKKK